MGEKRLLSIQEHIAMILARLAIFSVILGVALSGDPGNTTPPCQKRCGPIGQGRNGGIGWVWCDNKNEWARATRETCIGAVDNVTRGVFSDVSGNGDWVPQAKPAPGGTAIWVWDVTANPPAQKIPFMPFAYCPLCNES